MVPVWAKPKVPIRLRSFLSTGASTILAVPSPFQGGKGSRPLSINGQAGQYGQVNYAAAKSGLIGFTKTIAKEMASKKITANVVAPGFVETAMTNDLPDRVKKFATQVTPVGRFGKPEELAAAINFLTSDDAGYITGQVLCVDGGMSM